MARRFKRGNAARLQLLPSAVSCFWCISSGNEVPGPGPQFAGYSLHQLHKHQADQIRLDWQKEIQATLMAA